MRITVYGTVSWGIALSLVLCKNGHEVTASCCRIPKMRIT